MSTQEFKEVYERAKATFLSEVDVKDENDVSDAVLHTIEKASSTYALSVVHIRRVLARFDEESESHKKRNEPNP